MEKQANNTKIIPEHGTCFVCGSQNQHGMGLTWRVRQDNNDDLILFSRFSFSIAQQGPPQHAHGGASAAVLDEAMGSVCWQTGFQVLGANINIDYHLPVPLDTPLITEAWVERIEGRKVYARSHIQLPSGETAVSGQGLFIHSPKIFANSSFQSIRSP